MARGITKEDVAGAVDELEAAGKNVSERAIRAHLGTGSPQTVLRFLREIREERLRVDAALPDAVDADKPPAELVEKMSEAAKAAAVLMFREMAGTLNGRLEAARALIDADRAATAAEMDQVIADANTAREHAEELAAKLEASQAKNAELVGQMTAAEAAQRVRDADLTAERARTAAEIDRGRTDLAEANKRHETALADRDRELGDVRARLETAINEAAELRGRLAALQTPPRSGGKKSR